MWEYCPIRAGMLGNNITAIVLQHWIYEEGCTGHLAYQAMHGDLKQMFGLVEGCHNLTRQML